MLVGGLGVAGAVREEQRRDAEVEHILRGHLLREDVDVEPAGGQVLQRGLLHAEVEDGHRADLLADGPVALAREVMRRRTPLFGICFGSQILGRALGFGTYKLGYGHRGINQPVLDRTTGKVEVTSHNHGFAVDAPLNQVIDTDFGGVEVSHVCLNDDVVEGLRGLDVPAFTVQYHPEAAAGPHDAAYLFDRFCELMEAR